MTSTDAVPPFKPFTAVPPDTQTRPTEDRITHRLACRENVSRVRVVQGGERTKEATTWMKKSAAASLQVSRNHLELMPLMIQTF